MFRNLNRKKQLLLQFILAVAVSIVSTGCMKPEEYKADADKEVYDILENKWHPSFGNKVNYRISDSEPSPNDLKVPESDELPEVLSLAEAIAIATANNRNYQERKENLYKSALDLTGTRHKYAIQWFGTVDGRYTDDKGPDGGDDFEVGSQVSISKEQVFKNGIIFSTNLAINWARFLTGSPENSLSSILNTGETPLLRIPLLGNGAGKQAWETLTQTERNVLYQIRTFNRYRKTFVVGIIDRYYNVLQQRDAVINAKNNYERKQDSTKRLQMEAEAGRTAQFDVDEAYQSELAARDSYIEAQRRYESALDSFKVNQLSLPTDVNIVLDPAELDVLRKMDITSPNFTVGEAVDTALVRRLDLVNQADYIDDSVRKLKLASEGLGPQVNIEGNIEINSQDTDFTQLQFQEGVYSTGFNADLPFDRKDERNTYRSALISLTQSQRQYDKARDDIELTIKNDYRRVIETAQRYRIQKMSLDLAQRRVDNQKLLLDVGRGTVRQLLDSQDSLVDAQNALTGALINHTIEKLNFYTDVGILQVKPDGMWEIQAKWQKSPKDNLKPEELRSSS